MKHILEILKRAACASVLCLLTLPVFAAVDSLEPAVDPYWVLQLGYFANLGNAQNLKETLAEAGFEAQVLSTGEPGHQRYRVIAGREENSSGLYDLRADIKTSIGIEGFVVVDPLTGSTITEVTDAAAMAFEPLVAKYLVAQAGPVVNPNASPMRATNYDPMLNRTPQEEIDSMPGFTMAGMPIIPTIGVSLGFDDNITMASRNEISSWFYMISPAIRLQIPSDHSVLTFTAAANIVRYQDSSIDDRETWNLRGDYIWDISTRQNLVLYADYSDGVDRRGEGRRQGDSGLIPLAPDEWRSFGYGGAWDYGAIGARGRLSLRAGANILEYTNNREGIVPGEPGTRSLDRDWSYYGGTFYWRIAPKTSLLLDYEHVDMKYKEAPDSDSEIDSWMLGATWDASARTSGTIQYGIQKRDFADPTKESYDGPIMMATVSWRPRTYSTFTLMATRNTQEPNGNGDYVLRQDVTLSWAHQWATRFGTVADIGYGEDDYRPDGRLDEIVYWGIGANYTFNQHFRFGLSVTGYDRSSEIAEFEYNKKVYLLTLEANF